ncbi:hypothetical protein [uncultured Maritimibacter sp.]|uniref:hypothetical protein n=1 Tax=uncultured Maritimibacter sp. TaxID=991866 RepID=UPI002594AD93|nr:hypothetical protein [uncultured Maritimibacter sp.]
MTNFLDARRPAIVALGAWNAQILTDGNWLARYVLELEEGAEVEAQLVGVGNDQGIQKQVLVLDDFGIACDRGRLEIFETERSADGRIEEVLEKICDLLPHTPVSAVGVNRDFFMEEEVAGFLGLIETEELFDDFGEAKSYHRVDTLKVSENHRLNFNSDTGAECQIKIDRRTDFTSANVNMNFHQDLSGLDELSAWCKISPVSHWSDVAWKIMEDVYDVEKSEVKYF